MTHCGSLFSLSVQLLHVNTTFFSGCIFIAPNWHALMHQPQPLHAFSSTRIIPLSSSCFRASLGQAATQAGSSQCLQVTARFTNGPRRIARILDLLGLKVFSLQKPAGPVVGADQEYVRFVAHSAATITWAGVDGKDRSTGCGMPTGRPRSRSGVRLTASAPGQQVFPWCPADGPGARRSSARQPAGGPTLPGSLRRPPSPQTSATARPPAAGPRRSPLRCRERDGRISGPGRGDECLLRDWSVGPRT